MIHTYMRQRLRYVVLGLFAGILFNACFAFAWTGPGSSPPNGNVGAPINVGNVDQVKNANLGVNSLSADGNTLLNCVGVGIAGNTNCGGSLGRYLNFDATYGGTSGTA